MEPSSLDEERIFLRVSVEYKDLVDEDDAHLSYQPSSSSSSTSQAATATEEDDLLDENDSSLEQWSELSDALHDPHLESMDSKAREEFREAIVCVLGHVDTGKTSLLDKLRKSSVQAGEAGGITQQMGATYFPREALLRQTAAVNHPDLHLDIFLPGVLILDTPGHASFSAMRNRGSSLCDMAILVIDIMHGLERQTIESIQLLKKRRLPFVIALNKVDRIFQWKSEADAPILSSMKKQGEATMQEFNQRLENIMNELREQGVNPAPYYANDDFRKHVSIVPISAITGEGIADLLFLLIQLSQRFMKANLKRSEQFRCSVLEVRNNEGIGATASVILVDGSLKQGDVAVVAGLDGPIAFRVRSLLLPRAGREIRDQKNAGDNETQVKRVTGVMGVKIVGRGLDKALAGSPLMVPSRRQSLDVVKAMVMEEVDALMKRVDRSNIGVVVHASTIGSMEALLEFLADGGVPVRKVHVGKVTRASVNEAHMQTGGNEYRCILAFDVKVTREANATAEQLKVPIFSAAIIYHLFDAFNAWSHKKRAERTDSPLRPFMLHILPDCPMSTSKPCQFSATLTGELELGCEVAVLGRAGAIGSIQIMRRLSDGVPIVRAKNGDELTITLSATRESSRMPRLFDSFDPYSDVLVPDVIVDNRGEDQDVLDVWNRWTQVMPLEWQLRAEEEPAIMKIYGTIKSVVAQLEQVHRMARLELERRARYG